MSYSDFTSKVTYFYTMPFLKLWLRKKSARPKLPKIAKIPKHRPLYAQVYALGYTEVYEPRFISWNQFVRWTSVVTSTKICIAHQLICCLSIGGKFIDSRIKFYITELQSNCTWALIATTEQNASFSLTLALMGGCWEPPSGVSNTAK